MNFSDVDKFYNGALVTWLKMCLDNPEAVTSYKDLVDGRYLHEVFTKIDSNPFIDSNVTDDNIEFNSRANNLEIIYNSIRHFYEEEHGFVIVKIPNVVKLGEEPNSHVDDMKLLLTLLLGCAVQCTNKQQFIAQITSKNTHFQADIMEFIKQVTEGHQIVVSQNHLYNLSVPEVFEIIQSISYDRNKYKQEQITRMEIVTSPLERSEYGSLVLDRRTSTDFEFSSNSRRSSSIFQNSDTTESQLWKVRNEMEKTKEELYECIEELNETKKNLEKLQDNNIKLSQEAKLARSYRDKLDVYMEKSSLVEQLENKIARLEYKLSDSEFLKTRINELVEDNQQLQENCDVLYEQLSIQKSKTKKLDALEEELFKNKELLNNFQQDEFDNKLYHDRDFQLTTISDKLNETNVSEPDLIAHEFNTSRQTLYEEMPKNLVEKESQDLLARIEALENVTQKSKTNIISKKIKTLNLTYKKLRNQQQRLAGKVLKWESKTNLLKSRWQKQKCQKSTNDENSFEVQKQETLREKFDKEGNFLSYCNYCNNASEGQKKAPIFDFLTYNVVAISALFLLKKVFDNCKP